MTKTIQEEKYAVGLAPTASTTSLNFNVFPMGSIFNNAEGCEQMPLLDSTEYVNRARLSHKWPFG